MIKVTCDRCGKEVYSAQSRVDTLLSVLEKEKLRGVTKVFIDVTNGTEVETESRDMCSDCTEKFLQWFYEV